MELLLNGRLPYEKGYLFIAYKVTQAYIQINLIYIIIYMFLHLTQLLVYIIVNQFLVTTAQFTLLWK